MPATVPDLVQRALAAFDALAATAEPVADEWQYATDLDTVWRARLLAVAAARGDEPAARAMLRSQPALSPAA